MISGPNGKIIPIQKSTLRGLTYTITAEEVGEHIIQILINGQHIRGSPFRFVATKVIKGIVTEIMKS